MCVSGPLRVEPTELRAKASEINAPWPPTPIDPQPPCALDLASIAVRQIYAASEGMRSYVAAGQSEAKRLSESLNAAATAYEKVDEANRVAIENGEPGNTSPVTPDVKLSPPVPVPDHLPSGACPAPPGYLDVETAAQQISQPDQAVTLEEVAAGWHAYAGNLEIRAASFELDSVNWNGTAAESAADAMRRHRQWLHDMADSSRRLAGQAHDLAAAHRKAYGDHPTPAQVAEVTDQLRAGVNAFNYPMLMQMYQALQAESERVLAQYATDAVVSTLTPPAPPGGDPKIPPITTNGRPDFQKMKAQQFKYMNVPTENPGETGTPTGGGTPGSGPQLPPNPNAPTSPATAQRAAKRAAPAGSGNPPTGTPAGGAAPSGGSSGGSPDGMPGGLPGGGEPDLSGLPELDEPGLKPAAADGGGAGAGGGGGGVPPMPLAPNVGAETVAPAQGGAARGPSTPAGAAAGGGTMGGAGMGPMMGQRGSGDGGDGKEKRRDPNLAPDEDLYKEDRPWTEAVVGQRRRRDVQDNV